MADITPIEDPAGAASPALPRAVLSVRACLVLALAGVLAGLALMRAIPPSPPGDATRANLAWHRRVERLRQVCGKEMAWELCLHLHPELAPLDQR
jgi:hypothetical protein